MENIWVLHFFDVKFQMFEGGEGVTEIEQVEHERIGGSNLGHW